MAKICQRLREGGLTQPAANLLDWTDIEGRNRGKAYLHALCVFRSTVDDNQEKDIFVGDWEPSG